MNKPKSPGPGQVTGSITTRPPKKYTPTSRQRKASLKDVELGAFRIEDRVLTDKDKLLVKK